MRQLVYTMFISNNRASFHLWWKENLVKKSQNIMKMILEGPSSIPIGGKLTCIWIDLYID